MTSGSVVPWTAGMVRNPVPTFSVAVMVYRCAVPVRVPDGMRMTQARSCWAAFHPQFTVTAEMPGPRNAARTL